jgi:ketosteroid isomerase-like protein
MKYLLTMVLLFPGSFNLVRAQTTFVHSDKDSVLIKQLTDLEFELNDLLAERNFDTYVTYLADDYIRISADGKMKNKEQVLQQFKTTQPGKAEPEILQIRVYGNTAIMTIHLSITTEEQGKTFIRGSLLTKVFILRDGRWYMVSNQGTAIAK